jgi:hypothetical protein
MVGTESGGYAARCLSRLIVRNTVLPSEVAVGLSFMKKNSRGGTARQVRPALAASAHLQSWSRCPGLLRLRMVVRSRHHDSSIVAQVVPNPAI